jgi:hypothetical protein
MLADLRGVLSISEREEFCPPPRQVLQAPTKVPASRPSSGPRIVTIRPAPAEISGFLNCSKKVRFS